MKIRPLAFAVLAAPFFLAGCGEGYEMIKTDTMFPYGNQRTAGSGVAYVVAKMMPKKDVNLTPAAEQKAPAPPKAVEETKQILEAKPEPQEEPAPAPEPEPMEKVFNKSLDK